MKRELGFLTATALCAILLVGCEGEQGPAGVPGPEGPPGPDGADLNETCTLCHTDDTRLKTRQVQYESSVHATGGHVELARNATCAACHSHEGFTERIATGASAPAAAPDNPTPPNCRTCHRIHTTYTNDDFGFVTTAPVDLWLGGIADLGGAGNLCAECHQARAPEPMPVLGGPDVTFTETTWGPHNGPQANLVAGDTPWEFTGSRTITTGPSPHGQTGCPTCHMARAFGDQAGGHTLNMTYMLNGVEVDNIAPCEVCHSFVENFDRWGVRTAVDAKMVDLIALLTTAGIWDPVNLEVVPGTFSATVGAAWWNYEMVRKDRSRGIHNPPYIYNLLTNTIEAMEAEVAPVPAKQ